MDFRIKYKVSFDGHKRRVRNSVVRHFAAGSIEDAKKKVEEWKNTGYLFAEHMANWNPKFETKIFLEQIVPVCEI